MHVLVIFFQPRQHGLQYHMETPNWLCVQEMRILCPFVCIFMAAVCVMIAPDVNHNHIANNFQLRHTMSIGLKIM